MYITKIEQGKGKRYKVYSEDGFLFSLYRQELRRYHIEENTILPEEIITEILEQIVLKRAKERALYLLERRPYTCFMMKNKLKDSDYPAGIVEQVIFFLQKYHYLDDEAYIKMYVDSYSKSKSKRQIQNDLQRKGITKELVCNFMTKEDYSEEACFIKQFNHYIKGKDISDWTVRQKVFRYFYNKGFSYSLIDEYMRSISE